MAIWILTTLKIFEWTFLPDCAAQIGLPPLVFVLYSVFAVSVGYSLMLMLRIAMAAHRNIIHVFRCDSRKMQEGNSVPGTCLYGRFL